MTVNDFLCYIRDQLVEAKQNNDSIMVTRLFYTLTTFAEWIEVGEEKKYAQIVDDLISAIQHFEIAEAKATIPTIEQIKMLESYNA